MEYFAEAQLPHPEFRNISDGFTVTVFALKETNVTNVTDNVTDKVTDKVTDNQNLIIRLILENNKITTKILSERVKISQRKIKENIAKLKEIKLLERIGTAKGGYWKVNDYNEI